MWTSVVYCMASDSGILNKADCQARLNLLPYDGSPEIKEQNGFAT